MEKYYTSFNFFILPAGRLCSTTTREGKGEKSTIDATEERGYEEKSPNGIVSNDKQNVTSCENVGANGESKYFRRYITR